MFKYFKPEELKCKCNNCNSTGHEMDIEFMRKMDLLREQLGIPLIVSSAYRCPAHNIAVSMSGANGAHTTGHAIDIAVSREQAYELVKAALNMGFTGIGVNQKGESRFIHLDDLKTKDGFPRPTIWSY